MSGIIKDGTGKGFTAKVDDHNRLYVVSNTVSHVQHHASYHEDLFLLPFETVIQTTDTATNVAFFKNVDASKVFEYYTVIVSSNEDVEVEFYFDGEYTSGGNEITALNSHRGSGIEINGNEMVVYEGGVNGDLVLDKTKALKFNRFFISANTALPIDFSGALMIQNKRSAFMVVKGPAGAVVTFTAMTSYHSPDVRL